MTSSSGSSSSPHTPQRSEVSRQSLVCLALLAASCLLLFSSRSWWPSTAHARAALHIASLVPPSAPFTVIYFLHVPKAAGTSWIAWLGSAKGLDWPRCNASHTPLMRQVHGDNREAGPSGCFVEFGHQPYKASTLREIRKQCSPRAGCRVLLTVLVRDPLARLRSAYAHAARMKVKRGCCGMPEDAARAIHGELPPAHGKGHPLSLCEFYSFPGVSNVMSKQLVGLRPSLNLSVIGEQSSRRTANALPNETTVVDRAVHALMHFDVVGLQERFDESVALLRFKLGLEPALAGRAVWNSSEREAAQPHLNEAGRATGPALECDEPAVRLANAADGRVYEAGRRHFMSQLCAAFPAHPECSRE